MGSSSDATPDTPPALLIVLAAGQGTRMRSATPKVLHPIAGLPLLTHALRAGDGLQADETVVVVGHGREQVGAFLTERHPGVRQVVQEQQLGTGHAVAQALAGRPVPAGTVVVTYGDVPLLTAATLAELVHHHDSGGHAVTVLTAHVPDPAGYGRIVRDAAGDFVSIVEHRDADAEQQAITEINSGVYAFDGAVLAGALPRLSAGNAQGERYLTDVVALSRGAGLSVGTALAADAAETEGVNDRVQLADLARRMNDRLIRTAQLAGVTVLDPASTWLHADVRIGPDTVLHPGTSLEAGTVVGSGAVIGPATTLSACTVGDGATVLRSHCVGARVGAGATVGPFSFLRDGADLGPGSKVGAFVEIKKSRLDDGAKVPHLSYIGDATVGTGSNVGAGVITANYDGVAKYATTIGAHAFIGTDSTLVAPVEIADGAFVAAGSTITGDVAAGDLAVARASQTAVKGWVLRRRAGTAADDAARAAGARPNTGTGRVRAAGPGTAITGADPAGKDPDDGPAPPRPQAPAPQQLEGRPRS